MDESYKKLSEIIGMFLPISIHEKISIELNNFELDVFFTVEFQNEQMKIELKSTEKI